MQTQRSKRSKVFLIPDTEIHFKHQQKEKGYIQNESHMINYNIYQPTRALNQCIKYQQLPRWSITNFFALLYSIPCGFTCFTDEKSLEEGGAEDEIGNGDNGMLTDPSGPYFLGLPLFFLTVPSKPTLTGETPTLAAAVEPPAAAAVATSGLWTWSGTSFLGVTWYTDGASGAITVTAGLIPSLPSMHILNVHSLKYILSNQHLQSKKV